MICGLCSNLIFFWVSLHWLSFQNHLSLLYLQSDGIVLQLGELEVSWTIALESRIHYFYRFFLPLPFSVFYFSCWGKWGRGYITSFGMWNRGFLNCYLWNEGLAILKMLRFHFLLRVHNITCVIILSFPQLLLLRVSLLPSSNNNIFISIFLFLLSSLLVALLAITGIWLNYIYWLFLTLSY